MSNIRSINEFTDKKKNEQHEGILEYLDELKKLLNESGDKATAMVSTIITDDGYYNAVFVSYEKAAEVIGQLEKIKVGLIDAAIEQEVEE